VRAIRMLRSTWRGLETESRLGLHGHERGNPGHRQGQNLTDHRASPRPYQPTAEAALPWRNPCVPLTSPVRGQLGPTTQPIQAACSSSPIEYAFVSGPTRTGTQRSPARSLARMSRADLARSLPLVGTTTRGEQDQSIEQETLRRQPFLR
jgi:hypothetical protein